MYRGVLRRLEVLVMVVVVLLLMVVAAAARAPARAALKRRLLLLLLLRLLLLLLLLRLLLLLLLRRTRSAGGWGVESTRAGPRGRSCCGCRCGLRRRRVHHVSIRGRGGASTAVAGDRHAASPR